MRNSTDHMTRARQSGYALLMVIFMVATIMIFAAVATPNLLTQGRRDREQDTIWRGEQYQRAIGLYFRKVGRYPTKVDDLTKQTNGVRFLRQAYTDPTNKEDGSWRFIYVGINGQLVGSVRKVNLLQGTGANLPGFSGTSSLNPGGAPGSSPSTGAQSGSPAAGALNGPNFNGPPGGGAAAGTNDAAATNAPGSGSTSAGTGQPQQPGSQPGQQMSGGLAPDPLASQTQPLSGAVIGGNIIGVGSKTKAESLLVYQGEDKYDHWEFIWNPLQQGGIPGMQQGPNLNPNSGPNSNPNGAPGQQGQQPTNNPGGFSIPQFPTGSTTK